MKQWGIVKRMTPKQKGEILERLGSHYEFVRQASGEYKIVREADSSLRSDYVLRRCPHCGYIDVWYANTMSALLANPVVCLMCREGGL